MRIKSTSSEITEQIGREIGVRLKGGEVIELNSDLGGGKTTFTRGLVAGTGSMDDVASPTFTISRIYNAPEFSVHHFDFYRLQEPGIIAHELHEIIGDSNVVTVIEWGDIVADILPADRITISFSNIGDTEREITITASQNNLYAIKGITL